MNIVRDSPTSKAAGQPLAQALYTCHFTMAAVATSTALGVAPNSLAPHLRLLAAVILLGVLTVMAMKVRQVMAEWLEDLNAQERVLSVVLHGLLFMVPSALMRQWSPLAGFAILQIPVLLMASSPASFARHRILCALTLAISAAQMSTGEAAVGWIAMLLPLLGSMAFEHALFIVERHKASSHISPWQIARPALGRLALAAAASLPFLLLVWFILPEELRWKVARGSGRRPPGEIASLGSLTDLTPIYNGLLLTLIAIGVALLLRRIRRMLKSAPTPEAFADLVTTTMEPILAPAVRSAKPAESGALKRIIRAYAELSEGLKPLGLHRDPPQTPGEYESELLQAHSVPSALISEVTARFVSARYAGNPTTSEDAESFESIVRSALAQSRQTHKMSGDGQDSLPSEVS